MLISQRPTLSEESLAENRSKFVIEPLEPGFGYTLGNSLRRTLLSSIPGAAVTSIRIDGVLHEFSTVPGVKEDVTEIILNIKGLVVSSEHDEPITAYLRKTGSGQVTRDASWIERHIDSSEFAVLVDVTSAYSVISLMGPKAEALLSQVSSDDLTKAGLPFSMTAEIDVGYARPRAARMSYVGGAGYEMVVPTDQCVTLYDALWGAGGAYGLKDAGYYTIDALRIEAGRRAWGPELSPDETPWEAGLSYAVKMDKPAPFLGRDALRRSLR